MSKAKYANCEKCPLVREQIVPSFGPRDVDLIVVGENPGRTEVSFKLPFAGESGQLLRAILAEFGFDPDRVFYTNAALCGPLPGTKEEILSRAIPACQNRLRYALLKFPVNVPVLSLGDWSRRALGLRGGEVWGTETLTGKPAINTPHPALYLWNDTPGSLISFEQAVKKLRTPAYTAARPANAVENPPVLPSLAKREGFICVDIESNTTDWWTDGAEIFAVGVAFSEGDMYIFHHDFLKRPEWVVWLRELFKRCGSQIGGHNFKYDSLFLHRQFGTELVVGWDTGLMVNCFHEHWHKDLKSLVAYYFDCVYSDDLVWTWLEENVKAKSDRTFDKVPWEQMRKYLTYDVHYNLLLAYKLKKELQELGQWEMPYSLHEIPQTNLLLQMEARGIAVDLRRAGKAEREITAQRKLVDEQILTMTNGLVKNANSTKQVSEYLFGQLGLRATKKSAKTGAPSTDKNVLDALKEQHPIVEAILLRRRMAKMVSSYIKNLPDKTVNGRVHTNWKAFTVVTHRLAAENPAVQTIPRKGDPRDEVPVWLVERVKKAHPSATFSADYGGKIKQLYVPSPGMVFVFADGASWELRVATVLSKDSFLTEAYLQSRDPHALVCDATFGVGQWTKALRAHAKRGVFGSIYGQEPERAIATVTDLTPEQRHVLAYTIKNKYKGLFAWKEEIFRQAVRDHKLVAPHFNYVFHFNLVTEQNQETLRKISVNYLVQGIASMITSAAAIKAHPEIRKLGGHVLLLQHDSIGTEVPIGKEREAGKILADALVRAGKEFSEYIPWVAEIEFGPSWADLTELKLEMEV